LTVLSATLIVRDEAAVLPRCLTSLRGLADETIVVDTGSSDDTARIAVEFGARVVHHEWHHDFSEARNLALSHARGQWILYIDADECAGAVDGPTLAQSLANARAIAATVQFRVKSGFTRYREPRLFRNDPRIRFRNVIHETVMPDVDALVRNGEGVVIASQLAIDHFGYDGDQTPKHRRNVPLLRVRLAGDPDHVYSWNHLGQALDGLGETAGALEAWWRAIAVVRTSGVRSPLDALPYGSLLQCRATGAAASDLLDEARERFPRDWLFAWLQARRLMEQARWSDARVILHKLAAIDATTFCSEDGVAYDARIFGAATFEALAFCEFQLGRYEDSARWYDRACCDDPTDPAHVVKKRLAAARVAATISSQTFQD
jgi:tetratricopeptide (TPR) repeat protein